jgi:hypothetical protein
MESYKKFIGRKKEQLVEEKYIRMKDIGRKGNFYFKKEACTFMVQTNMKRKVFVIERLRKSMTEGRITHKKSKIGDIEYRIGYYIVGRIGRAKNRWVWGQYCPMIPKDDFEKLISKAKEEKTILE